jgi:hypothetical protein
MNTCVPEEELVGIVEMLTFVSALCAEEETTINQAIYRFCGTAAYQADELASDLWAAADLLARAMGFANAAMEFQP